MNEVIIVVIHKDSNDLTRLLRKAMNTEEYSTWMLNSYRISVQHREISETFYSVYPCIKTKNFDFYTNKATNCLDAVVSDEGMALLADINKGINKKWDNQELITVFAIHFDGKGIEGSQPYIHKFNSDLKGKGVENIRFAYYSSEIQWKNVDDLRETIFSQIWGSEKNKFELNDLKKQVKQLLLPLSIDLQGVVEVKPKSVVGKYLENILGLNTKAKNIQNVLDKWSSIKSKYGWLPDAEMIVFLQNLNKLQNIELVESYLQEKEMVNPFPAWIGAFYKEIGNMSITVK